MLKESRFSIAGMRCGGCAISLEKRLRQAPGISAARINATTHGLVVRFDESRLSERAIESIVSAAGYEAYPAEARTGETGAGEAESGKMEAGRTGVLGELAVAGFGMMNIMLFSIAVWSGLTSDMGPATVQFMNRMAAALAIPVVFFAGRPFFRAALSALAARRMSMDVAISFAIIGTFLASLVETWNGQEHVYFDAAIALTFFLLVGRQLDHMLRSRSATAANTLRNLIKPDCQRLSADGRVEQVRMEALCPGDIVLVPAGERAPADGILLSAGAIFDESILTGESAPVAKKTGDRVFAATLNPGDPCRLRVAKTGRDSSLEQIARLVEEASAERGQRQHLADRFAAGYGPFVLASAGLAFCLWVFLFGAGLQTGFEIAVAVLVVTCPCAAGLATPAVAARAANLLLAKGVIVRSGAALETLAQADQFICDKTGTLSLVESPVPGRGQGAGQGAEQGAGEEADIPAEAGALARASTHPLARALACALPRAPAISSSPAVPPPDIREFPGAGLRDGEGNALGSAAFTGAPGVPEPDTIPGPEIWFRESGRAPVRITFAESPRPGLPAFLEDLQRDGTGCLLLSGDRRSGTRAFAARHGIPAAEGGASPEAKLRRVREFQQAGKTVAMLGDGLNDAAALSAADISLSFAEASGAARNAAHVIIVGSSLEAVTLTRHVARAARRRMTENLTFAALYNIITVPVAVAGFLTPFWAAIFMSASSVLVMLNACRVRLPK